MRSKRTSKVRKKTHFVILFYVHRWYAEKNCFMGAAEGFDVSAAVSLLKRDEMHTHP